jgi:calcineurin-like phosphoesterase family protein
MTDQNDTHLSHYPNAPHHTTSDANMSFIEINTKKQFKLHIHTTVPSAEIKE